MLDRFRRLSDTVQGLIVSFTLGTVVLGLILLVRWSQSP
jgi:hypothetical protein